MARKTMIATEEKVEELRIATREANLALADLKATLKEARSLLDDVKKLMDERAEELVATAVANEVARLSEATDKAIEDATDAVFKRFDKLESVIFDGRKGRKRTGGVSLEKLIETKLENERES